MRAAAAKIALAVATIVAAACIFWALKSQFSSAKPPKSPQKIVSEQEIPDASTVPIEPSALMSMDGAAFAEMLDALWRRRPASVRDIRLFLQSERNFTVNFPDAHAESAPEWTKFSTARTALLALLGEIGGRDAAALAREVALSTNNPFELALAARVLEEQQPQQHRDALIAAARKLLAKNPENPAPLMQLLAFYGAREAVADIERMAREQPQHAEAAISALALMRGSGGDAVLLDLWRHADLPMATRVQLARALGVIAPENAEARAELRQLFANTTITDPQFIRAALDGIAHGESFPDERLVPQRGSVGVVWAPPQTDWVTARLAVLDAVQSPHLDAESARQIQQLRDELLEELERTQ
jgi:hypothetical protein